MIYGIDNLWAVKGWDARPAARPNLDSPAGPAVCSAPSLGTGGFEMPAVQKVPRTVDEYIARFPTDVQSVLESVRATIRRAAPKAEERISYRMPAFFQNGVLVYFGAFKTHIGLYPPIRGDAQLQKALAPYAGEKGNLRFPLNEPMPHALIRRAVKSQIARNAARAADRKRS